MENRPSQIPRDLPTKAALNDAAALASIAADEIQASYAGPDRTTYLRTLGRWLADLGGVIEDGQAGTAAKFGSRRIAIRFGAVGGHR